ncbi:MAG: hypothetical protein ACUVWO_07775 [Thermodesulfobacteriota bacterium]
MSDDFGIDSTLDRLPPTEKLRDSKKRMNHQEVYKKGKRKKRDEESVPNLPQKDPQEDADSSEKEPFGKIIDIVI